MIKKNYIPTINISSLLDNKFETNESLRVIKKIQKACVDVGFFQIINHGINLKEINKISKIGENFFELDIKDKMRLSPNKWNKRNKNIYRGYFPNDVNGKEGLDLGDLRVTKKYSRNLNNQFIEYIDLKKSFNKKATEELSNYYDDMFNLGETLFKCIIKLYNNNTNISKKAFSRLKTLSTLRFNYYPKQTKPVEISKQDGVALGCETHVDSSVFTILYQNKIAGLQLQNKATKMWHDVPVNKSAFVVNTGRALEFLSNGLFKATNHRVLWNKKKRLSIPFFFEPSFDFKMSNAFLNNSKKGYNKVKYEFFLKNSLKKFIEYKR